MDYKDIDKAIEVDGDYVVFNLNQAFPPSPGVLAGRWASIVSKEFAIENGGWDGTEATWKQFNNPSEGEEILYDIEDGTGLSERARLSSTPQRGKRSTIDSRNSGSKTPLA